MSAGRESATVQAWIDRMASTIASISPENEREATAYGQWFEQDAQRREGVVAAWLRPSRSCRDSCGPCW